MKKKLVIGIVALASIAAIAICGAAEPSPDLKKEEEPIAKIKSAKQLLGKIQTMQPIYYDLMIEESATSNDSGSSLGGTERAKYSETNTQVAGVDEGELIKTDGNYIYSLHDNVIRIHAVDGGVMTLASEIKLENRYFEEIYLSGDKLAAISTRYEELAEATTSSRMKKSDSYYTSKVYTAYSVYDIHDRNNPVALRFFELEGRSATSRLIGDTLYFIVNKDIYYTGGRYDLPEILPVYYDSVKEMQVLETVPVTDICYFPGPELAESYMIVGCMDLTDDRPVSFDSYLNAGHQFYMNLDSLYIVKNNWWGSGDTKLYRFAVALDGFVYQAEGTVKGTVLDQYSMDEHNGYFRIATTENNTGNYISVFDQTLKLQGRTEALAADETIHAVRFIGNMGYMVTYRQTDPLYAVDLSDPASPKVLDALKIPGFSQYLHPVGENLLIGFGRHTTETYTKGLDGIERVVGTRDMGAKVSLFDISDPYNLKEIDVLLLGEDTYAEVFDTPKALMTDPERNIFGFYLDDYLEDAVSSIRLISIEGEKLKERKVTLPHKISYGSYGARLIYIGNTLYGMDNYGLTAYEYDTLKSLGQIKF